jgi:DNA-binding CsgD family transcriptional regulator
MSIIPGLEDNALEVYSFNNEAKAVYNGMSQKYLDLPIEQRFPFQSQLCKEDETIDLMIEMTDYKDPDKIEEKFVMCRYGTLNKTPDLKDGVLVPDPPRCPVLRYCKGFGKVCKIPGNLTRKEYIILRHIGDGLQDSEIALAENISINTVLTHLAKIRQKLDKNNRIELMKYAQQENII